MATIRKRSWVSGGEEKTAWVCYYADQDKKRHIKTFRTKREADAWSVQAMHEVKHGTHTPPSTSVTVAEAGEKWLEQAKIDKLERSTIQQYEQHLRLHIVPLIGGHKLANLRPHTVTEFRNKLITEGRSHVLAGKVLVSLGAILDRAMANNLVAQNVLRTVTAAQGRRTRKLASRHKKQLKVGEDIPTIEELRAILDAAKQTDPHRPWRALMGTVIFTGLRASELRGLRWSDVELDHKPAVLHVRQRADRFDSIGDPKSKAGQRTVPLAPLVVATLKEWRIACSKGELNPLNLVFPNRKGGVEDLSNITVRALGAIQQAAGLCTSRRQPRYSIHAFRHAAASLLIAEGHSAKWIQNFMGHSSIAITFDTYGHLFPSEKDDQEAVFGMQRRVTGEAS
jgi:integrase